MCFIVSLLPPAQEDCSLSGSLRLLPTVTITASANNSGRVEICLPVSQSNPQLVWGTIYSAGNWGEKNGQVACRELGFDGVLNSIITNTYVGCHTNTQMQLVEPLSSKTTSVFFCYLRGCNVIVFITSGYQFLIGILIRLWYILRTWSVMVQKALLRDVQVRPAALILVAVTVASVMRSSCADRDCLIAATQVCRCNSATLYLHVY